MYIFRYNTIFPPDNERLCKEKPDDETIALQITAAKNYWGHQQKGNFVKCYRQERPNIYWIASNKGHFV